MTGTSIASCIAAADSWLPEPGGGDEDDGQGADDPGEDSLRDRPDGNTSGLKLTSQTAA